MKSFPTRVYIAKTDGLSDDGLFEKLYKRVICERQKKIQSLAIKEDKILSLAAELLLEKGLGDLGINNFEVIYGEHGKPYLKGGEAFFNLSHSGNTAMCAVSCREVGCDVQKVETARMGVAKRYFCTSEYEMLRKATEGEREQLFYRLWTLKESYVKALGGGLAIPFSGFEVRFENGEAFASDNCGCGKLYFKEYNFNDGYRYAVCGKSENFREAEFVSFN